MMKKILALCALTAALAGCAPNRYYRPDTGSNAYYGADMRRCMYEANQADQWGSTDYLDECMSKRGFTITKDGDQALWLETFRSDFEKYDAEKKSPGR